MCAIEAKTKQGPRMKPWAQQKGEGEDVNAEDRGGMATEARCGEEHENTRTFQAMSGAVSGAGVADELPKKKKCENDPKGAGGSASGHGRGKLGVAAGADGSASGREGSVDGVGTGDGKSARADGIEKLDLAACKVGSASGVGAGEGRSASADGNEKRGVVAGTGGSASDDERGQVGVNPGASTAIANGKKNRGSCPTPTGWEYSVSSQNPLDVEVRQMRSRDRPAPPRLAPRGGPSGKATWGDATMGGWRLLSKAHPERMSFTREEIVQQARVLWTASFGSKALSKHYRDYVGRALRDETIFVSTRAAIEYRMVEGAIEAICGDGDGDGRGRGDRVLDAEAGDRAGAQNAEADGAGNENKVFGWNSGSKRPPTWNDTAVAAFMELQKMSPSRLDVTMNELIEYVDQNWDRISWSHHRRAQWRETMKRIIRIYKLNGNHVFLPSSRPDAGSDSYVLQLHMLADLPRPISLAGRRHPPSSALPAARLSPVASETLLASEPPTVGAPTTEVIEHLGISGLASLGLLPFSVLYSNDVIDKKYSDALDAFTMSEDYGALYEEVPSISSQSDVFTILDERFSSFILKTFEKAPDEGGCQLCRNILRAFDAFNPVLRDKLIHSRDAVEVWSQFYRNR